MSKLNLSADDLPITGTDKKFAVRKARGELDDHARHVFYVPSEMTDRFRTAFDTTGIKVVNTSPVLDGSEEAITVDSGDTRRVLQSVLNAELLGQASFQDAMRDLGASRQLNS